VFQVVDKKTVNESILGNCLNHQHPLVSEKCNYSWDVQLLCTIKVNVLQYRCQIPFIPSSSESAVSCFHAPSQKGTVHMETEAWYNLWLLLTLESPVVTLCVTRFNPPGLKVNYSEHAVGCWENQTSAKVTTQICKVMGSHLNPQSFAENGEHLIPAPKG
jgi:hypothetical protein